MAIAHHIANLSHRPFFNLIGVFLYFIHTGGIIASNSQIKQDCVILGVLQTLGVASRRMAAAFSSPEIM
jgi:hypothetical protein